MPSNIFFSDCPIPNPRHGLTLTLLIGNLKPFKGNSMLHGRIIAVSIKSLKTSTQTLYALTKLPPPRLPDSLSCDGGLAWQSGQIGLSQLRRRPRACAVEVSQRYLCNRRLIALKKNLLLTPWQVDMTSTSQHAYRMLTLW